MFLRRKGASWSDILLRDEILHAGIRHCRKPLQSPLAADDVPPAVLTAAEAENRAEAPQTAV